MTAANSPYSVHILGFAGSLRQGFLQPRTAPRRARTGPRRHDRRCFRPRADPSLQRRCRGTRRPRSGCGIQAGDPAGRCGPDSDAGIQPRCSGVTKNAIDWASRPPRNAVLSGKPVGIMGASPGITGTARGQSQLRQALNSPTPTRCRSRNFWCSGRMRSLMRRAAHGRADAPVSGEVSRCTDRMDDAVQDRARLRRRGPIRP